MILREFSNILVIDNPFAGSLRAARTRRALTNMLKRRNIDFRYARIQKAGDARAFGKGAVREYHDLVLVLGGDGTLAEVATGMYEGGVMLPLVYIPCGTGNIVGRTLGIPRGTRGLTRLLSDGRFEQIDLGCIPEKQQCFVIGAGVGWDADMIGSTRSFMKKLFGPLAYVGAAMWHGLFLRNKQFAVTVKGKRRIFYAHTILVLNIASFGIMRASFTSKKSMKDGMFDVVAFSSRSAFELIRSILGIMFGRFQKDPRVRYLTADSIHIQTASPTPLQIDGDYFSKDYHRFSCHVLPQALTILSLPERRKRRRTRPKK